MDNSVNYSIDDFIDEYDEELEIVSFQDALRSTVFFSDYDLDVLEEFIEDQFTNYTKGEDTTNYFEDTIQAFKYSEEVIEVEFDEYTQERRQALTEMYDEFIDFMVLLIEKKLKISIPDYEPERLPKEDLEYIIDEIYKFFILNARKNFRTFITNSVIEELSDELIKDSGEYYNRATEVIQNYFSILPITPEEFLLKLKQDQLLELYSDGRIAGNFLQKYSPKLYRHDDLLVDILTQIMIKKFWQGEASDFLIERTLFKNGKWTKASHNDTNSNNLLR